MALNTTMKNSATVYYGPDISKYPDAGSVSAGEAVTAYWLESSWCYIQYVVNSTGYYKRGYVKKSDMTSTSGLGTLESNQQKEPGDRLVGKACNVYFGPGDEPPYTRAGSLSQGEIIEFLGVKLNDYAFVEYKLNNSSQYKRGWVYANNLGAAPTVTTGSGTYTEGTVINSAGDYWHITQGWNGTSGHLGLDVIRRNSSGSKVSGGEVYAIADGTVVAAGYNSSNGYVIALKHTTASGKTYYSVYGHLKEYYDSLTTVSKNQAIGIMGNTGSATTGEHVHVGITKNQPSPAFLGYSRDSNGNKTTFTETGPGYKDDRNRYYNPTTYFTQGDSFISNNYS